MKAKSTILLLYIVWLIAAVMLVFAAAEKQPDNFYTVLRWVCCAVFVYSAVISFQNETHVMARDFRCAGDCV
jgi:threonine/homoserine/homoserine lactone efflux protein